MKTSPLFHAYPAVPLMISLIIGIVLGRQFFLHIRILPVFLFVMAFLVASLLLRFHRHFQTLCLLLASVLTGILLIVRAERMSSPVLPAEEILCRGIVIEEPVDKPRSVRLDIHVVSGPLAGHVVRAYLQKDTLRRRYLSLQVGSGIDFYSQLLSLSPLASSHFDYPTYLRCRHIVAQTFIYADSWERASVSDASLSALERVKLQSLRIRHKMLLSYHASTANPIDVGVISAMVLGDKSGLTSDIRDIYAMTGTSHILALSGTHLGIIFSLLVLLLGRHHLGVVKSTLVLLAIWSYVFLVGMPLSVLRAVIMMSVYVLARLTGRNAASLNSLAFTAFLMLWANPLMLYDMGFQLSFLSVASILLLYRPLMYFFSQCAVLRWRLVRYIFQLSVLSTVAQIGTAPLSAYYFGRISFYFLLSNMIVVPMATCIIYASVLLLALTFLPVLQQIVLSYLASCVAWMNVALGSIASWPGAVLEGIDMSLLQLFLCYVVIICLCGICGRIGDVYLRQKM